MLCFHGWVGPREHFKGAFDHAGEPQGGRKGGGFFFFFLIIIIQTSKNTRHWAQAQAQAEMLCFQRRLGPDGYFKAAFDVAGEPQGGGKGGGFFFFLIIIIQTSKDTRH